MNNQLQLQGIFTFLLLVPLSLAGQNFGWSSQVSGVTDFLRDVHFSDAQTGWTVGDNGVILHTNDGGSNWTSQASGTPERIRAIYSLDNQNVFAVGGVNNKVMLKTTNGGSNWTSMDPNNQVNQNQIIDVNFWSTNKGWVITTDSIYSTNDGGNSWFSEGYVPTIERPFNQAITSTSDTTAFIASRRKRSGVVNPYADVFYRLEGNNSPWVQSSGFSFSSSDVGLYSIEFADFNNGFAGGANGILYKAENLSPSDLSGPWNVNFDLSASIPTIISSISFPSSNRGMFGIVQSSGPTNYYLVYHTTNQGATWSSPDTIPGLIQASMHAPDNITAYVVGPGGVIYKGLSQSTGLNSLTNRSYFHVYPNPVSSLVNFELPESSWEFSEFKIYDRIGNLVKKGKLLSRDNLSSYQLDISDLPNGLFHLTIHGDGSYMRSKFLKVNP